MSIIKIISIGLIILAIPFRSFSQSYTITGAIETKEANPLDYATILLLRSKDSSVVTGTTTNEKGVFLFKNIVCFIGYFVDNTRTGTRFACFVVCILGKIYHFVVGHHSDFIASAHGLGKALSFLVDWQ